MIWRLLCMLALSSQAQAEVSVADDAGRQITLAQPARRIISLSPHATELLYEVGAGGQLVGRDRASDFPRAAQSLPVLGQYGAFNLEAILALRPDLVVTWEGAQAGPVSSRLRELGIAVFASQPSDVAQIPTTLLALGQLSGHVEQAKAQAGRFEQGWLALQNRYRQAKPLRILPQVGDQPAMTVNDKQFLAAVFRACGSRNPMGKESAAVPLLSPEAVVAAKVDAIVALVEPAQSEPWLTQWQRLPGHPKLLAVAPDGLARPSSRLLPAATALCMQLDKLRR